MIIILAIRKQNKMSSTRHALFSFHKPQWKWGYVKASVCVMDYKELYQEVNHEQHYY